MKIEENVVIVEYIKNGRSLVEIDIHQLDIGQYVLLVEINIKKNTGKTTKIK
jgi:hypothetical protein